MNFKELFDQKQIAMDMEMVEGFKHWLQRNIDTYTSNAALVKMRANTVKGNNETIVLLKSPIKQIVNDVKKLGLPSRYAKAKWIIEAFGEMGHEFKKQSTYKKEKYTIFNGFKLNGHYEHLDVISIDEVE